MLVKNDFTCQKKVSAYATALLISANYLNQLVKNETGFTASYHILQQIIIEAKRQALFTERSMKEVCYYLGFNSGAHFSKFFRANSGMNFTTFRNMAGR